MDATNGGYLRVQTSVAVPPTRGRWRRVIRTRSPISCQPRFHRCGIGGEPSTRITHGHVASRPGCETIFLRTRGCAARPPANGDQASGLHHPEDESKTELLCVPCGPVQRRGRETRAERGVPFQLIRSLTRFEWNTDLLKRPTELIEACELRVPLRLCSVVRERGPNILEWKAPSSRRTPEQRDNVTRLLTAMRRKKLLAWLTSDADAGRATGCGRDSSH